MTQQNENEENTTTVYIEKKVQESFLVTVLKFGVFFILNTSILIGVIKFITPLRHWLFSEIALIEKINDDNQTMSKVSQELARKSSVIDTLSKDIEDLKKKLEDEKTEVTGKIESIHDWMKVQNVPNADAVINKSSEAEKLKDSLVEALTKKEDVKGIVEKIKAKPLKDDYKTLVVTAEELDVSSILDKDELIKQFDAFYKAAKVEGKDEKALEGFSSQFIAQIKRNIKITIDGKESKNTIKDVFENAKKKLEEKNLQGALDELESVHDIDDLKKWIKDVQARLGLDSLIQKLNDFKGPYNE